MTKASLWALAMGVCLALTAILLTAAADLGSSASSPAALQHFAATMPRPSVPLFDEKEALALAAMPLSCIDHPQGPPPNPFYLYAYETKPHLIDEYSKTRAFYGCYDWHSSVNSIWTLATFCADSRICPSAPSFARS